MATNHTENYQLNQWESTDQVLRTDFNADNQKLDAALHDLAEQETADVAAVRSENRLHLLEEWVATGTVNQISIPLSPYTGEYHQLYLAFQLKPNSDSEVYCNLNNISGSSGYVGNILDSCGALVSGYALQALSGGLTLFPMGSGRYVGGMMRGLAVASHSALKETNNYFTRPSLAFPNLKSIQFSVKGSSFSSGSRVMVYGLK